MYYADYYVVLFVMQNKLGIEKPFMYELVPVVGEIMEDFYPEVTGKNRIYSTCY